MGRITPETNSKKKDKKEGPEVRQVVVVHNNEWIAC